MPTNLRNRPGTTRRNFIADMGLAAAALILFRSTDSIDRGWLATAEAATLDEIRDTLNGLLAFILPGPDQYSVTQGVSTAEPGALAANVTDVLMETVDQSATYLPSFSAVVATVFNDLAGLVNPTATGPFASHFAHLSFNEKVAVFQIMDSTDSLKPLIGILPAICAFLVYSEAGVFDPVTKSITDTPVGWKLSNYDGVADGRDEFQGYLRRRRMFKDRRSR